MLVRKAHAQADQAPAFPTACLPHRAPSPPGEPELHVFLAPDTPITTTDWRDRESSSSRASSTMLSTVWRAAERIGGVGADRAGVGAVQRLGAGCSLQAGLRSYTSKSSLRLPACCSRRRCCRRSRAPALVISTYLVGVEGASPGTGTVQCHHAQAVVLCIAMQQACLQAAAGKAVKV